MKVMKALNKSIILHLIWEYFVTLILVMVAFNFFKILGTPIKRGGFFCDDVSLKYPYHPDTINLNMLLILSFYGPIVLIVIGETVLWLVERLRRSRTEQDNGLVRAFLKLHYNLTTFLCGFALQAFFMFVAKIVVARLRPHFFDACQPYRRLDGSTCDDPKNHGVYIEDYECNTNNKPDITVNVISHLAQSFPSGHSSFIFYAMIFIILYLQHFSKLLRQQRINVGLFIMVVQMFCGLVAWFVAVSRVMDHKHHWSDVSVGIMLGTLVAIAVTMYLFERLRSVNSVYPENVISSNSETTVSTTTAVAAVVMPSVTSITVS